MSLFDYGSRVFDMRRVLVLVASIIGVSACSNTSDDREANADRSELFTELASETDFGAPSDVSALDSTLTYNGVAAANFVGVSGEFSGTADATLTADFASNSIEGRLTNWTDTSPSTHSLSGEMVLSNGVISDDGSFSTQFAGNISRSEVNGGPGSDPFVDTYIGAGEGQIYDSVDGDAAATAAGSFSGVGGSSSVEGEFIAAQ